MREFACTTWQTYTVLYRRLAVCPLQDKHTNELLNTWKAIVCSEGKWRKPKVCCGGDGGSPCVFPITFFQVASLPFLALGHLTGHTVYLFLKICHQPGVKLMLTGLNCMFSLWGFHFFPLSRYSQFSVFPLSALGKSITFKWKTL